MEGIMPDERGGSSRQGGKGGRPASSEESFADTQQQQQYAQYQQQQQHGGYYQAVAPYPADYSGYGPPGYGGYGYPYPGQQPQGVSHEFRYPAHFPYPPLAPMPPNPPPGPPHYSRSHFPQISPDSVPPRGKRRPEAAAGRDPPSSSTAASKKARRGAEDLLSAPRRSSALPPASIAFRASSTATAPSPQQYEVGLAAGSSLYRGSPTESLSGMGTPSSLGQSRYDSSLGLLAKRFVHRLRGAPGSKMDLNQLVQDLGVQKRRIYDITNVLEGIGLIAKEGKKLVAWVQDPKVDLSHAPEEPRTRPSESGARTEEEWKKDIEAMRQEETSLTKFIEILQRKSQSLSSSGAKSSKSAAAEQDAATAASRQFMFVRYTDITSLPMYGNDSIVGVKAPPGTKVEIPDSEPGAALQHRMYLNSSGTTKSRKAKDPIRVYLIRPEALPASGSEEAKVEPKEPPIAVSRSHAQRGTPTSAGRLKRRPNETSPIHGPPSVPSTSYPTPSWGPPGHPPPPMHHHDPHRAVGVTPEEFRLGGTPKSSRGDRFRRHEFVQSTPQRPTPPRTSPPSTPFAALGEGRWDAPPTPVASGPAAGFFSPAWSRTGSYFGPPWEEGSVDTPNAFAPPGTYGTSRTHSPMTSQQELYNMPLQSPAGPNQRGYPPMGSFLSPTVPHVFSPTLPGIHYRTTDAQFPLPALHAEGRAAPTRSLAPDVPSRSTISELPDPTEANEPPLPGPATRVKPRRRR